MYKNKPWTNCTRPITHLIIQSGGGTGVIHAISTSPNAVYTIQNNSEEVKCLDIDPALGFRPDLAAAAWNQFLIISDASVSAFIFLVYW